MQNKSPINDGMNARERRHAKRRQERERLSGTDVERKNDDTSKKTNFDINQRTQKETNLTTNGFSWSFLNDWSV
jgi:hypothetical protein